MSALGQKQTFAPQKGHVALPPKADMCGANTHVRFGPKADIGRLHSIISSAVVSNASGRVLGPIARTPPLGLSCCRRRCGPVAVLTQFQGKRDEENAKYDRIGRDCPDQPKCAGPWGNQDDGAEYYRQHAAKD